MSVLANKNLINKAYYNLVGFDKQRRCFLKMTFISGNIFFLFQHKLLADWTFEFEINLGIIRFLIKYDSNREIGNNPPSGDISAGKINGQEVIVNYDKCCCRGIYKNLVSNPENPSAEDIDRMINASDDGSIRYKN
ncbi:hypothetical protein CRU92_03925 [Arcobacter sp. FW59]|nr:hypothetical protein CRU92_03925 [Arcobacter sp. FW59]